MTDLPVLDPQPLRDLLDLGASVALIHELITLFKEDVPTRMALLKTAQGSWDARQAMMEAHQLKGALSNLGLLRFADLASRLEVIARDGHLEQAPGLIDALPAAYGEALHALEAEFPQD